MRINYQKVADLPPIVRGFCFSNEAWIVGSGAKYLLDLKEDTPRDWDILIPFWTWGTACKTIPQGQKTNSQGGVCIKDESGLEIDVWAGDVGWFLSQVPVKPAYAVHPKSMNFLTGNNEYFRDKTKLSLAFDIDKEIDCIQNILDTGGDVRQLLVDTYNKCRYKHEKTKLRRFTIEENSVDHDCFDIIDQMYVKEFYASNK